MRFGLKEKDIDNIIKAIAKNTKIEKIILYGSRAKGNFKHGSDIDLTLIGENLTMKELTEIYIELDELYLPYSFDVSIFTNIQNEGLIEHINRVGIEIYTNFPKCINCSNGYSGGSS